MVHRCLKGLIQKVDVHHLLMELGWEKVIALAIVLQC